MAACTLVAFGAILVTLNSPWRDRALRPGPLAQQHAQLLHGAGEHPQNCGACHAAARQNVAGWAASLVVAQDDLPTQSQLCMSCHSKTIQPELATAAHNLPGQLLQQMTMAHDGRPTPDGGIACAACHREHHGAQADLTAIDNAACQSCHARRYQSFASDHPGFAAWPYMRRTRIAFNHATHGGKYFSEKKQEFDCRKCHLTDETGRVQQLARYENTCAGCHDEKIATSFGGGISILSLPTIDTAALKKSGRDVGSWPMGATGDFDGRLPPMMKLLLAADPKAAAAIDTLGPGFEFQDVDPDEPRQLSATADIAGAIKRLFLDLSARGRQAVRERLSVALGREVTEDEAGTLTAGISPELLRGAGGWLGANANTATSKSDSSPVTGLAKIHRPYGPAGAWSRADATFVVRYNPAAHADPVLASWLELLASTPQLETKPIAAAMFKELTKPTAPGLCASCHSTELTAGGNLAINWKASDRTNEPRSFTKFSHSPHLVLPQLAHCTSCHVIDLPAGASTSYVDQDVQHFVRDFKPMAKGHCAQCHTKNAAGDRCQSCHYYHVQLSEPWRIENEPSDAAILNSVFRTPHSAFH